MANPLESDDADTPPPAPSKAPIIMAVCAALIVGAAGGMFVMLQKAGGGGHAAAKGEAAAAGEHGGASEHGAAEEVVADTGEHPVITMAPFVVNLTDAGDEPHYLKCTLALELGNAKLEHEFEKLTPRVRNAVVMFLSSIKVQDTIGKENKLKMLEHLRGDLQEVLGKGGVREIYLTEFVIQ